MRIDRDFEVDAGHFGKGVGDVSNDDCPSARDVVDPWGRRHHGGGDRFENEAIGARNIANVAEVATNVEIPGDDCSAAALPCSHDPPGECWNDKFRALTRPRMVEGTHDDDGRPARRGGLEGDSFLGQLGEPIWLVGKEGSRFGQREVIRRRTAVHIGGAHHQNGGRARGCGRGRNHGAGPTFVDGKCPLRLAASVRAVRKPGQMNDCVRARRPHQV